MLGKLIKYEFKATGKLFLLLYAALLLMSVINMFVLPLESYLGDGPLYGILMALCMVVYVLLIAAIGLVTFVVIVQRFYSNLLGDQGYLSFTLPVSPHQHLLSKLLTATVWVICSGVMIVASIVIMLARVTDINEVWQVFGQLGDMGINTAFWIMMFAILIISSAVAGVLQCYTAMSFGPYITKNRLLGSIIAFIAIYIGMQIVSLISIIPLGSMLNQLDQFSNAEIDSMSEATIYIDNISNLGFWVIGYFVVFNIILAAVFYFVTHYMLNKKLNLG